MKTPDFLAIAKRGLEEYRRSQVMVPLEETLKGHALELWWSEASQSFFLVADEEDARRLGGPRGSVYTGEEARRIVALKDPGIVREIHAWKRQFNGVVREVKRAGGKRA